MAVCLGTTGERVLEMVVNGLEDGSLTVSGGNLVAVEEEWITDFREACRDKGVPCEKVAEKAIQSIRKGML
jgi:hypothetical protein